MEKNTSKERTGMMERELKNIFTNGPITTVFIAESIQKHSSKTSIGGHSIFLGQVRADQIEDRHIKEIEYSAYEELALEKMYRIREEIFKKYPLTCMHVHHSLGKIAAGEICLFVFTSSDHRKPAIDACAEIVERIKSELPIWGKELFEDETHQWKQNK
jgi:molybdopterin synthase catalytic subunit